MRRGTVLPEFNKYSTNYDGFYRLWTYTRTGKYAGIYTRTPNNNFIPKNKWWCFRKYILVSQIRNALGILGKTDLHYPLASDDGSLQSSFQKTGINIFTLSATWKYEE